MGDGIKACIICFRTNSQIHLLALNEPSDEENIDYCYKLKALLNEEVVQNEYTLLCTECANDLNFAYGFKNKVVASQNFWKNQFKKYIVTSIECINKSSDERNDNIDGELYNNRENCSNIQRLYGDNLEPTFVLNEVLNIDHSSIEPNEFDNNFYGDDNQNELDEHLHFLAKQANEGNFDDRPLSVNEESTVEVGKSSGELSSEQYDSGNYSLDVSKTNEDNLLNSKSEIKTPLKCFKCKLCPLTFDKRWKWKKHHTRKHEDRSHICTHCGKAFKQTQHLQDHMTSHTGAKDYSCNICGKNFPRLSSQKRHMRTHDAVPGQKVKKTPFLCTICGKSFPYSNGAQRHMRIHTGEKKFECDVCSRKFSQSTHLHVHKRIHSGERLFMCNYCGKTFPVKATLTKHIHTHDKSSITQNMEPNLSQTKAEEEMLDLKELTMDYIDPDLV